MSEFSGSKNKVRCVDCTNLSGNHCLAKKVKVAPRKRRVCKKYNFAGEYDNRETMYGRYVPNVDRNTRRLLQRFANLGIQPVSEGQSSLITVPKTTASEKSSDDDKLIWTPDDE